LNWPHDIETERRPLAIHLARAGRLERALAQGGRETMIPRTSATVTALVLAACLLAIGAYPAPATTVFDDHFTGNSGGIPAGWHYFWGPGTAVESGTVVTLNDDIMIASDAAIDPRGETVVLTMELASTNADDGVWFAVTTPTNSAGIACGIHLMDGMIEMGANDPGGGEQSYILGYLDGYSGGAIRVTITLESATFSVSTDSPPFSSGSIAYATAFPTFTPEVLGSAVNVFLANDVVAQGGGSSAVDRVTVDVQEPSAVESTTFGRIKTLYRR
jgi:hypothetical protein